MDQYLVSYFLGITIVFLTHLFALILSAPVMTSTAHSVINLIAGGLIAWYFVHKEKYI